MRSGIAAWALQFGLAFVVTAGAAASAGCVATESGAVPRGVAVSGPPPAPIPEAARPPAPGPNSANAVWIAGYWHWTGMQYTWIPGHWESAPPGAAWSAPRYVSTDGAYFYEAGAWRGAAGAAGAAGNAVPPGPPPRANALH
jgi:hypothetical protein